MESKRNIQYFFIYLILSLSPFSQGWSQDLGDSIIEKDNSFKQNQLYNDQLDALYRQYYSQKNLSKILKEKKTTSIAPQPFYQIVPVPIPNSLINKNSLKRWEQAPVPDIVPRPFYQVDLIPIPIPNLILQVDKRPSCVNKLCRLLEENECKLYKFCQEK